MTSFFARSMAVRSRTSFSFPSSGTFHCNISTPSAKVPAMKSCTRHSSKEHCSLKVRCAIWAESRRPRSVDCRTNKSSLLSWSLSSAPPRNPSCTKVPPVARQSTSSLPEALKTEPKANIIGFVLRCTPCSESSFSVRTISARFSQRLLDISGRGALPVTYDADASENAQTRELDNHLRNNRSCSVLFNPIARPESGHVLDKEIRWLHAFLEHCPEDQVFWLRNSLKVGNFENGMCAPCAYSSWFVDPHVNMLGTTTSPGCGSITSSLHFTATLPSDPLTNAIRRHRSN